MKTDNNLVQKSYNKCINSLGSCIPDISLDQNEVGSWRNKDVARLFAVKSFGNYIKKYNISPDSVLTFDGKIDWEPHMLQKNLWTDLCYSDDPINNDVQGLNLPKKDYDCVILSQTFEHLVDPYAAVESIYNHLSIGGYFFCNWPIINIRHMEPLHFFTGLTVTYINYILLKAGFEILECGSWGNFDYISHIFRNQTWPDYTQISSQNHEGCPCIGWVLAKRI